MGPAVVPCHNVKTLVAEFIEKQRGVIRRRCEEKQRQKQQQRAELRRQRKELQEQQTTAAALVVLEEKQQREAEAREEAAAVAVPLVEGEHKQLELILRAGLLGVGLMFLAVREIACALTA
jgi:hypothetical protein